MTGKKEPKCGVRPRNARLVRHFGFQRRSVNARRSTKKRGMAKNRKTMVLKQSRTQTENMRQGTSRSIKNGPGQTSF